MIFIIVRTGRFKKTEIRKLAEIVRPNGVCPFEASGRVLKAAGRWVGSHAGADAIVSCHQDRGHAHDECETSAPASSPSRRGRSGAAGFVADRAGANLSGA